MTRNSKPAPRDFVPVDMPDEIRPSVGEAFRVYPAERPTEGDVFLRLAAVFAVAAIGLAVLAGWAFAS